MTVARVFASFDEALAFWSVNDQNPLRAAVVPPCDVLGDEVYDVFTAVAFRALAGMDSAVERLTYLHTFVEVHGRCIEQLRTVAAEHQHQADENIARIDRMLAIVAGWQEQLADGAAQLAVEGRDAA